MSSRLTADVNQPKQDAYVNNLPVDYSFARNVNAYTGEYYEPDPFEFLVLEDASAKQFDNSGKVFLGTKDQQASVFDKWGDAGEFARIAGGIG